MEVETESKTDEGHAFISYVREDSRAIDQLERDLAAAGIKVWRDVRDILPGDDWKREIRRAIENDSFAFIACFSANSRARKTTYQWEELTLAAENFRLRPPGRSWIYPVRLDEGLVSDFDLGAGRNLTGLQQTDLFGPQRDANATRLIGAIQRALAAGPPKDTSNLEHTRPLKTSGVPEVTEGIDLLHTSGPLLTTGVIAVTFPTVLAIGKAAFDGPGILPSVSAYFYSSMIVIYVIACSLICASLFFYRGPRAKAGRLMTLAGTCLVGTVIFRPAPIQAEGAENVVGLFHSVLTIVFFLVIAYICAFEFTSSRGAVVNLRR